MNRAQKQTMKLILAAVGMLWALDAGAQDVNGDGYQSLLVPIAFGQNQHLPGAFGTQWSGEVWIYNGSAIDIQSPQPGGICVPSCDISLPRGFRGLWPSLISNLNAGAMFHIPAAAGDGVFVNARLLETTRMAQPTGVEVPIVKERDFFTGERWLLAVPVGESARTALRVYDPYARSDTAVVVDFFSPGPDFFTPPGALIHSTVFHPAHDPVAPHTGLLPSPKASIAASFDLATEFPALRAYEFVHIRLTPVQAGRAYWAMANVTHNETQHVLLVTSHP